MKTYKINIFENLIIKVFYFFPRSLTNRKNSFFAEFFLANLKQRKITIFLEIELMDSNEKANSSISKTVHLFANNIYIIFILLEIILFIFIVLFLMMVTPKYCISSIFLFFVKGDS